MEVGGQFLRKARMARVMEQKSPEWFHARCGNVGASRIADVMARTKSGPSASRKNYLAELLTERLTGDNQSHFESEAMRWGTDNEPLARAEYEARTGRIVAECGFIMHPSIPRSGASPDGLVGIDGVLEIKCPNTSTHLDTLLNGTIDTKYKYQMAWQLECTARDWADFVSYDPRLPDELSVRIIRYVPDKPFLDEIRREVILFLSELEEMEAKLRDWIPCNDGEKGGTL